MLFECVGLLLASVQARPDTCKLNPFSDHSLRHVVDVVQALQLEQEIAHLQHEAQHLRGHNEELQAQLRSQGPVDRRVAELEGEAFVVRLRQTCVSDFV